MIDPINIFKGIPFQLLESRKALLVELGIRFVVAAEKDNADSLCFYYKGKFYSESTGDTLIEEEQCKEINVETLEGVRKEEIEDIKAFIKQIHDEQFTDKFNSLCK